MELNKKSSKKLENNVNEALKIIKDMKNGKDFGMTIPLNPYSYKLSPYFIFSGQKIKPKDYDGLIEFYENFIEKIHETQGNYSSTEICDFKKNIEMGIETCKGNKEQLLFSKYIKSLQDEVDKYFFPGLVV